MCLVFHRSDFILEENLENNLCREHRSTMFSLELFYREHNSLVPIQITRNVVFREHVPARTVPRTYMWMPGLFMQTNDNWWFRDSCWASHWMFLSLLFSSSLQEARSRRITRWRSTKMNSRRDSTLCNTMSPRRKAQRGIKAKENVDGGLVHANIFFFFFFFFLGGGGGGGVGRLNPLDAIIECYPGEKYREVSKGKCRWGPGITNFVCVLGGGGGMDGWETQSSAKPYHPGERHREVSCKGECGWGAGITLCVCVGGGGGDGWETQPCAKPCHPGERNREVSKGDCGWGPGTCQHLGGRGVNSVRYSPSSNTTSPERLAVCDEGVWGGACVSIIMHWGCTLNMSNYRRATC